MYKRSFCYLAIVLLIGCGKKKPTEIVSEKEATTQTISVATTPQTNTPVVVATSTSVNSDEDEKTKIKKKKDPSLTVKECLSRIDDFPYSRLNVYWDRKMEKEPLVAHLTMIFQNLSLHGEKAKEAIPVLLSFTDSPFEVIARIALLEIEPQNKTQHLERLLQITSTKRENEMTNEMYDDYELKSVKQYVTKLVLTHGDDKQIESLIVADLDNRFQLREHLQQLFELALNTEKKYSSKLLDYLSKYCLLETYRHNSWNKPKEKAKWNEFLKNARSTNAIRVGISQAEYTADHSKYYTHEDQVVRRIAIAKGLANHDNNAIDAIFSKPWTEDSHTRLVSEFLSPSVIDPNGKFGKDEGPLGTTYTIQLPLSIFEQIKTTEFARQPVLRDRLVARLPKANSAEQYVILCMLKALHQFTPEITNPLEQKADKKMLDYINRSLQAAGYNDKKEWKPLNLNPIHTHDRKEGGTSNLGELISQDLGKRKLAAEQYAKTITEMSLEDDPKAISYHILCSLAHHEKDMNVRESLIKAIAIYEQRKQIGIKNPELKLPPVVHKWLFDEGPSFDEVLKQRIEKFVPRQGDPKNLMSGYSGFIENKSPEWCKANYKMLLKLLDSGVTNTPGCEWVHVVMVKAGSDVIPAVSERLTHKDYKVRISALDVLGKLGSLAKSELPKLQAIVDDDRLPEDMKLQDEHKYFRLYTVEAICRIEGKAPQIAKKLMIENPYLALGFFKYVGPDKDLEKALDKMKAAEILDTVRKQTIDEMLYYTAPNRRSEVLSNFLKKTRHESTCRILSKLPRSEKEASSDVIVKAMDLPENKHVRYILACALRRIDPNAAKKAGVGP